MDANTAGLSGRALVAWLRGLSDNVSQLGGEAARPTVDAVLRCRAWLDADADDAADADADALAAYAQLLENLVSAHALLVRPVVLALVQTLAAAAADSPAARSAKYDRIHHVLHAVIRLIPSGPSFMHAMLSDAFPHKSENVLDQMWYLKNLFRIVSYAPVLRNSVWALAIDRATQIDVEIQSALDDLSEEDYNQVLAHCFDIDAVGHDRESISFMSPKTFATAGRVGTIPDELQLDDDDDDRRQRGSEDRTDNFSSSDEDSDEDDSEEESDEDDDAPPPLVVSDFKIMSGKLDSIIHYLLGQITLIFSPPPLSAQNGSSSTNDLKSRTASAKSINQSETREEALEFFSVLLQIFERTILPTHQCKYVQFLYFHACSMSSKCTESFLVLLAQKTFDTSSPAIIRVAASAYLSSFVARAKFVEIEAVLYCLKMLNGWALTYVDENESSVKTGGVLDGGKTHACFYAVIQALLYVFCFRWREIVAAAGVGGDDSLNDGRNIEYGRLPVEMNGFQKLVQSRFHPLKVCTKSVVAEFARITHKLDMLYCYTHIQQRPVLTNSTSANTLRPPPPQPVRAIRLTTNTLTNNSAYNSTQSFTNPSAHYYSPTDVQTPDSITTPTTTTTTTTTTPITSNQMSYVQESVLKQQQQQQQNTVLTTTSTMAGEFQYTASTSQDTIGTACLEAFFPFDPCHLIMSKSIIEPGYNEWMEEDDIVGGGVVGGRDSDIDYISSSFDNQMSMSAD